MEENKMMVLVVDDDHRMVRTLCDILTVHGYEVREAFSGEEAVEQVKIYRLDCVLMDLKMPGSGGINALQMIRAQSPELPVLLMSAYATDEQSAEAKKQGAYAVLTKPLDLQMVLSFLSLLRREESILVVDDDPAFYKMMKDILEARGCSVEAAVDLGKALERMEENYKLVVMLDLKLGDTNGLDVLKAIRAKYPAKPVVLVAGYGKDMADAIEKGLQIGAYTCLYKPLEIETLIRSIRDIRHKKLRVVLGEPFEK